MDQNAASFPKTVMLLQIRTTPKMLLNCIKNGGILNAKANQIMP